MAALILQRYHANVVSAATGLAEAAWALQQLHGDEAGACFGSTSTPLRQCRIHRLGAPSLGAGAYLG